LVADAVGLRGVEAYRVEAADASGGAALRQGFLAVASGAADVVMVLGVEKVTDLMGAKRLSAFASSLDADFEAEQGGTPAAMAALIMRRYMYEYGIELDAFAGFSVNAHANGALNPKAMYRNRIKAEKFPTAPLVAPPVSLFDAAPEGDGAAALILTTTEMAKDLVPRPVRIAGSAVATDALAIHDRPNPLVLEAVALSTGKAFAQAGLSRDDIHVFEAHDSFTIMTALSLEACGYAGQGEGHTLARDEVIGLNGSLPLSTFGGLKARGHAGGATGVYQAGEVVLQLRGEAGSNQVPDARTGMALNLGGLGGTAVTHIFEALDL
jgi:acetyl-CoA C-acetyltransferase